MKKLENIELLSSKRDFFTLLALLFFLLFLSLSYQYYKYHKLTKFDSQITNAVVLKQYTKIKQTKKGKQKRYEVLKLRSNYGFTFYTIASKNLQNIKQRTIQIEIWTTKISFYEYLRTFFVFSKILKIYKDNSLMSSISNAIASQHRDKNVSAVYEALFLAKPLPRDLQKQFANLGISHLIAISGFHLGVLSFILFLLLKYPYKFLQNRYFPYRSYTRDTFFITASILLTYMLFLSSPPSLLRSFIMLIVGFILYDRGMKIISMQTLSITILLILALFPQLLFSIGFWLSVSGVFYIFLFLLYFKHYSKIVQFLLIPFWVYFLMLPYSLTIFGNFSLYHPLSILYSTLFTLFYPLALFLHLIGFGNLLDPIVTMLLYAKLNAHQEHLHIGYLGVEIILSLLSVFSRRALLLLLIYVGSIFIYFIYNIA